jgi:hypothetical protein
MLTGLTVLLRRVSSTRAFRLFHPWGWPRSHLKPKMKCSINILRPLFHLPLSFLLPSLYPFLLRLFSRP